jgi:hypothetical protein
MYNFRSDDCNLTATKPCFISYLVSSSPISRKSWLELRALEYRINLAILLVVAQYQENHDWNYEL